jgi:cysteine desulfurase
LFVRRGTPIDFQQEGGGQEQGRRGGTENVPGIVGLGLALERAEASRQKYVRHCQALRDQLQSGVLQAIPDAIVNGPADLERRLPNNLNITIPGVQGETLLLSLDMLGVAASSGSACTTGNTEPSHVLLAMGLSEAACRSSLRFTVGKGNTSQQIDAAIAALSESAERVRSLAEVASS